MATKKNILILCSRLDLPGGIERAIVNTANLFYENGHNVTLLILDENKKIFYPLSKGINFIQKPLNFGITNRGNMLSRKLALLRDVLLLRRAIRLIQPHIIIGTEYPFSIAAYYACKKTSIKVFAWEHHHFFWLQKNRFWNYLFRKIYPKLTAIICLNVTEQLLFEKAGCTTVVIPNFINGHEKAVLDANTILSVGWLIHRKGVDLVPCIAQEIFHQFPNWKWVLIGSGKEEELLQKEISKRNLQTSISVLPPLSADLDRIYANASMYVMTSRFECFPMVLLEAMSHGIPAIAFDCPTGPSSIIQNNIDGLLIEPENTTAMAAAIIELIKDEEKRRALGQAAHQNIGRFSPENIYPLWQELLSAPKYAR